jgi:hypothetical protein
LKVYELSISKKEEIYGIWESSLPDNMKQSLKLTPISMFNRFGTFQTVLFYILAEAIQYTTEIPIRSLPIEEHINNYNLELKITPRDKLDPEIDQIWCMYTTKKYHYRCIFFAYGIRFESENAIDLSNILYNGHPVKVKLQDSPFNTNLPTIARFPTNSHFSNFYHMGFHFPLELFRLDFYSDEYLPNFELFNINGIVSSIALLYGKKINGGIATRVEGFISERKCRIIGGSRSYSTRKFESSQFESLSIFYDQNSSYIQSYGSFWGGGSSSSGYSQNMGLISTPKFTINNSELEFILKASSFFKSFSHQSCDYHEKTLQIPLVFQRFIKFLSANWLEDKLLESIIVIELLFSTKNHEIQFEIGLKLANIFGSNLEEKQIIIRLFKQIYGMRSALVHAGISPSLHRDYAFFTERKINFLELIFDIIRLSMLFFISYDSSFKMKDINKIHEIGNKIILNNEGTITPSQIFVNKREDFWEKYKIMKLKRHTKWIGNLKKYIREYKETLGTLWNDSMPTFQALENILSYQKILDLQKIPEEIAKIEHKLLTTLSITAEQRTAFQKLKDTMINPPGKNAVKFPN